MIEIASGTGNITNGTTRIARFVHNRTKCPNPSSCVYLINVFYPDSIGPKKVDFKVGYNTTTY